MQARRRWTPYLLLFPAVMTYAIIVLGPIVATAGFSFFEWNGYGDFSLVGFDNYQRAFSDTIFRSSFVHIFIYVLITIVLEVLTGLILAGLVSARRGEGSFFRAAFFVPVMLPMVVVAVLWSFIYSSDFGLVNAGLDSVGAEGLRQVWLGDTRFALIAVSVVSGWVFSGFYMAIFYAAFQQIPTSVIEAAQLDGANQFQVFWRVKLPMVRNAVEVALLLCITGGFQSFDLFYVLTNGGPYNATEIPTTYLVKVVFRNQEVGYGSAMAVILTVVVVIIGWLYSRLRGESTVGMA